MTGWTAQDLWKPEFMPAKGITMAVWDTGNVSHLAPVVLGHRVPGLAFSWRHQGAALPGLGIRAIAPVQRGDGLTSAPDDIPA